MSAFTIGHNKKTITSAGTESPFSASTLLVRHLHIRALSTNTNVVFIGNSGVASSNGYQLAAGQEFVFGGENAPVVGEIDLNQLYLDVTTNNEGVTFIYFK